MKTQRKDKQRKQIQSPLQDMYLQPNNDLNNLKYLMLSVFTGTLSDKQPPPANFSLEKGFIHEILGHLMEFKIRN